MSWTIRSGRRDRPALGVVPTPDGAEIAVFSNHAERIELCLFDAADREVARLPLPARDGGVWHGVVPGLGAGARYGFRAHGPWAPEAGHRFNPAKLLLDPYARAIAGRVTPHIALNDQNGGDSARYTARSVIPAPDAFDWGDDRPPRRPMAETVIYEAHVKGLTRRHPGIPDALRGTYDALGHPALIDHLTQLGVTAIELLPIQAFLDETFLLRRGLTNYWGYNSIGFFAPEPRYFGPGGAEGLKSAVRALHAAGIEVILDVVYNHTAEGDDDGPALSFRGLDNASYYRLGPDGAPVNDTGCGNTLRCDHPMVMRLILDSLRHWVETYRIDGFRFDLATVLGRTGAGGFDPQAALFSAMLQDPALAQTKLIVEPWDVGIGGYRLGGFPPGCAEWNDRFRDDVRRFWRGDAQVAPATAARVMGSAEVFDCAGRRPWASINAVTMHDGFTLKDAVSYARKHNQANGERNRDGHGENFSSNGGVEGPTDDPAITARRDRRRRNLLATLMLSQGTPMLLAGDELGHSQGGNNNAYCQDNAVSWIDWAAAETDLVAFVRRLTALRRRHPALRQTRFLHGGPTPDGGTDVAWIGFDGGAPRWDDPDCPGFAVRLREAEGDDDVVLAMNAGDAPQRLALPADIDWVEALSTAAPDAAERPVGAEAVDLPAESLTLFRRSAP